MGCLLIYFILFARFINLARNVKNIRLKIIARFLVKNFAPCVVWRYSFMKYKKYTNQFIKYRLNFFFNIRLRLNYIPGYRIFFKTRIFGPNIRGNDYSAHLWLYRVNQTIYFYF
jgi:hypothetical protein